MLLFLLFCLSVNFLHVSASFNLTLLHNNDFHARYAPTNVFGSPCTERFRADGNCIAGVARTVQKVSEIRAEGGNVLFLNAGDHFQGTVWYTFYKWKIAAEFVKALKHDAMAVGNHEFDDGVDGLLPFIEKTSPLPVLSCNIDTSGEAKLRTRIKQSVILTIDGHKIGVIGYTTPDTVFLSSPGDKLKFGPEIECIQRQVDQFKENGTDIIIALGHSGFAKDLEIAKSIPDLDVVVGGHTNTFLYTGDKPPSIEKPLDKYPVVVDHGDGRKTLVVQAYAYGKYLGRLDMGFDDKGHVMHYSGNPILMDKTVKEDPLVAARVAQIEVQIKAKFGLKVGETQVLLDGETRSCRMRECLMGNLVADAFVDYMIDTKHPDSQDAEEPPGWTYFPVSLLAGGSIRATIDEKEKDKNITLEDLYAVMPFGNTIEAVTLKGSKLKKVFEHSVGSFDPKGYALEGRFLQVSGVKVIYDVSRPVGDRVVGLKVRCGPECRVPQYFEVEEEQNYTLIVTNYMAQGGDGYLMLKDEDVQKFSFNFLDFEVVKKFIEAKSPITLELNERIVFAKSGGRAGNGADREINAPTLLLLLLVSLFSAFG